MDTGTEASDFLRTRRARISPEAVGLTASTTGRRVKGLRREEVATLAGVSAEYYNRMERGKLAGVSESVLYAVARALQLDESEEQHLFDLARAANAENAVARPSPKRTARSRANGRVQRLLDGMSDLPAYARNGRTEIIAMNQLGAALMPGLVPNGKEPANIARYLFLDPSSQEFYDDWERVARDMVAAFRIEAGRTPFDRSLTDLIGELSTRSDAFRTWWASHNVRLHTSATKTLHNPTVGEVEVTGEALTLASEPDVTIITYVTEPASVSEERLRVLASWAASNTTATAATTTR
ncbi:helix-turn-helix domain-containing protein [Curtobacterium sp. Leaf261]|uniref:helix-turn-helix domain-containing protein n=1 Tax=Curtobacterium sp. Leaf261 TaxID=1736311 RepID=UPI0006FCBAA7|nr:helix-turn-helix transcriptional regulator [Curtobacterium sp. Leaf261]KQO64319.1 XRE family transcriptional regulator [Curtobacterium sp. Leaf261]